MFFSDEVVETSSATSFFFFLKPFSNKPAHSILCRKMKNNKIKIVKFN